MNHPCLIWLLTCLLVASLPLSDVIADEPAVDDGMVLIPAGSFQMADSLSEGDSDERPVHEVYVSAFYIDKYDVTKALWNQVANWRRGTPTISARR